MTIKGKVKWFNDAKGFGFITVILDGKPKDVFVHHTAIINGGFRTLKDDEDVTLEVVETKNGLTAANVVRLEVEKKPMYKNQCPNCGTEY